MATQSFRRIIDLLEQHGVEYVVVGGVAAVLQGAPVTTFDLDALFKVDAENIERLAAVLTELDARYRERRDLRPTRRDLAAGQHLLLLTNCGPFDLLGIIGNGKRYEDVAGSSTQVSIGDRSIKVLSIEALIEDKKALNRDKDLAAIRLLEALVNRKRDR
jgi:hypothetical protein